MEWYVYSRLDPGVAASWITGLNHQGIAVDLTLDLCESELLWCCDWGQDGGRLDANHHDLDSHYGIGVSLFHRGHLGVWPVDAQECKLCVSPLCSVHLLASPPLSSDLSTAESHVIPYLTRITIQCQKLIPHPPPPPPPPHSKKKKKKKKKAEEEKKLERE